MIELQLAATVIPNELPTASPVLTKPVAILDTH
jgi:hypothetical protein